MSPRIHLSHGAPFNLYGVYEVPIKQNSKLHVLSFMFISNCRRCPLPLNLTSFVLNVSKFCTLCPLTLT
ncbi:hypothetical protein Hanom_Chr08g00734411 [Helianthus anomalus]